MKPGQRRVLPETPEGRLLDLIETAKAHFRAKVEHPFRIIKCQFGFRKVFYRGIRKNDLKSKLLLALANLWMVRERIPDPAQHKGLVYLEVEKHPEIQRKRIDETG